MSDDSSAPRPLGEISQEPAAFEQFLERNQKALAALVVLIVVAAGALIIFRGLEAGEETTAGAALSKADDLAALQKIVKDHGDTAAAGSSSVLLSEKQWSDGQQDAAITTLKEFIAREPSHPAVPTAQASLGSKLAAQGKKEEATAAFQQVVDNEAGRFLAPYALLSMGDIARGAGDTAAAEGYYTKARDEYPESTFGNTAISRLGLLKAKPPVEIEAPPSPPAPEPAAGAPGSIPGLPDGITFPAPAAPGTPAPAPAPEPVPAAPEPAPKQ